MLSFDKFDDQKENVEIKSKEDDTVGIKNIEENEEENFQTTISPSRFSNGVSVKSKEKNTKSVKSIVEIC